ncbi:MAG: glutathione peroxidase [Candidatus Cardinium sp.]|uniref:glutathione peroxidase n=1 Tax=Cardinium endosymbiont of Dermatophagoides farinae TaxID=2597823 RepID=UPI0011826E34|nr:glutathione peroxidase [Cardinium endosymbiont of Dermatophagoides farinae]TSJ80628.1 glutathione peroxidase [Cardinium endosymbiont of Dermatophagoides farinae]UWW96622.1 MAG: glutathione peroxidase [Candidatus Cardinium sp.]
MNMQTNHPNNFSFTLLDGTPFHICNGQVVLVVNTASRCGFARQFDALQKLHDRYHADGFTVLGVSSQSFGKQEFDKAYDIAAAIKNKCSTVTFPITELTAVRGKAIHPFYAWAAAQVSLLGRPKWNFHKYLIGKNGACITWFSSATDPLAPKVIEAVEAALAN